MRAKYIANRQAKIDYAVKWGKENPQKRRAIRRRYTANNLEKVRAKRRRDDALQKLARHLIRAGVVPPEILQQFGLG